MNKALGPSSPRHEAQMMGEDASDASRDCKRNGMRLSMDIADLVSAIFGADETPGPEEEKAVPMKSTKPADAWVHKAPTSKRKRNDGYVSAYYPHIASRKKRKAREIVEIVCDKNESQEILDECESDVSEEASENEKAASAVRIAPKDYLEYLCKTHPLPKMRGPRWWNVVRYQLFSTHRILFLIVLGANLFVILLVASDSLGPAMLRNVSYPQAATAFTANLLAAIIIRHEHFVNLIFRTALSLPHRTPLCIRKHAAKVYCYGGVHSGCGASVLAWYMLFLVLAVKRFYASRGIEIAFTSTTTLMSIPLCIMVFMSHPTVRVNFHDVWELSHRYAGWSAIALAWVLVFLIVTVVAQNAEMAGENMYSRFGETLSTTPAFYMLIASTILIVYPWVRTRRRDFEVEALSSHAVRLRSSRIAPVGSAVRLADSPLVECHAFAAIPNVDGKKGYAIILLNAGDWTSKFIEAAGQSRKRRLWVRGTPTIGVIRIALLFQPVVIVATGSGIGPCLSFLQMHPTWPVRVVWSARHPVATYGVQIVQPILKADKDAIIIDTKSTGYPDLPTVAFSQYMEIGAEAVVIISNQSVTRDVVYKLETVKVPTFGVIFDS